MTNMLKNPIRGKQIRATGHWMWRAISEMVN